MKLARQYGAIASVKDSNLLFIRQGQGKRQVVKRCRSSLLPAGMVTVTASAWRTGELIPG